MVACYGPDTWLLLHDGGRKQVRDLQTGDMLMGVDGTPRRVISTAPEEGDVFEISPVKGDPIVVGRTHVLSMHYSPKKYISDEVWRGRFVVVWFDNNTLKTPTRTFGYKHSSKDEAKMLAERLFESIVENKIVTISLDHYMRLSKTMQKYLKVYRGGVTFTSNEIPFDAYIIGYWLGDGTSSNSGFTTQESTVLKYIATTISSHNLMLSFIANYAYNIRAINRKTPNVFLKTLADLDMINNKHIPAVYKFGSDDTRLALLAGLIDSDGYHDTGCYEITQKSRKLAEDIEFICRSLGFACYSKVCKKGCLHKGTYREGEYIRMSISGDLSRVPVLCPRKKASARKQIKDVLVSGITVKALGRGSCIGLTLADSNDHLDSNFIRHG
jgi:hypothetical protein